MDNIVELSSGHVFAKGSVKALSSLFLKDGYAQFTIFGVGFTVNLHAEADGNIECLSYRSIEKQRIIIQAFESFWKDLYQEAKEKLLNNGREIPE